VSEERKADMEAALVELEFEIALAIKQGLMPDNFQWMASAIGPDGEPWFAVLTIGKVTEA
jgi:hypothetical protein